MNRVHILDCTLRDGGYCNLWDFGFENTKDIISGLIKSNVEIIECGFLTDKVKYNKNVTKFTDLKELSSVIPDKRDGKLFVAMVNYGEYDINLLPNYDGSSIDGIRVAFHKKNMSEALDLCEKIKSKGYKVFIQAMVSLSYTDEEFLRLINYANKIGPYAFYIVDSFGMMKKKSLTRLFYMVEHNLNENIWIGFHSHNNMQLAFSNAQELVNIQTNRNLIIDSSVYGMGRGAGNLNTELFVEYLNDNCGTEYNIKPLLKIIDDIINGFYQKNYWGYSLPNYISASHNAHPNYASYLDDKKTLTVENINEIFDMMDSEKSLEFDKEYIEELYMRYMNREVIQEARLSEFKDKIKGKRIILIAPGRSSVEETDKILRCIDNNTIVISINHNYNQIKTDYIFISNLRRFSSIDKDLKQKLIITSNISADQIYLQVKYHDLLNDTDMVKDNAGLMCVKLLMDNDVKEILLAGFDGYSHETEENYAVKDMAYISKNAVLDALNRGISDVLKKFNENVKIRLITSEKYIHIQ